MFNKHFPTDSYPHKYLRPTPWPRFTVTWELSDSLLNFHNCKASWFHLCIRACMHNAQDTYMYIDSKHRLWLGVWTHIYVTHTPNLGNSTVWILSYAWLVYTQTRHAPWEQGLASTASTLLLTQKERTRPNRSEHHLEHRWGSWAMLLVRMLLGQHHKMMKTWELNFCHRFRSKTSLRSPWGLSNG